jgi:hypothetical protein
VPLQRLPFDFVQLEYPFCFIQNAEGALKQLQPVCGQVPLVLSPEDQHFSVVSEPEAVFQQSQPQIVVFGISEALIEQTNLDQGLPARDYS